MSRWRREDAQYEHQFLLKLPPERAKQVRDSLRNSSYKRNPLLLDFNEDCRHATVKLESEVLHGKMIDLPCVIESQKTVDRKTFYKTADISQMLVFKDTVSSDEEVTDESIINKGGKFLNKKELKKYATIHGITPPLKNVRKRRFRKTAKKKYVHSIEVERELRRLFKEDVAAVKVSYEVVKAEEKPDDGRSEISELDGLDSAGPTSVLTNVMSTCVSPYVDEIADVGDVEVSKDNCDDVAAMLHMSDDEVENIDVQSRTRRSTMSETMEEIDVDDSSISNTTDNDNKSNILSRVSTVEGELSELTKKIDEEKKKIEDVPNVFLKNRLLSNLEDLCAQEKDKLTELNNLKDRL